MKTGQMIPPTLGKDMPVTIVLSDINAARGVTMDHVATNRAYWNGMAGDWVAAGERLWALETPEWGIWGTPDAEAPLLPKGMKGLQAAELGCGTGYVSGWMARRGADVTGIDVSGNQLATARRLAAQHGAEIAFVEGNAEATGLPAASFDFAVSEYGAAIWCDPAVWLREAHRLLKPGGRLAFLGNHPLAIVTTPMNGAPTDRALHRSYRHLSRIDWTEVEFDPGGIEFNRPLAGWFALFHEIGFAVTDYRELYARDDHGGTVFSIDADWARDYPSEQVWWLRKL
ncbi:MAG: class I SAM-dependent methyltransferase [Pseudomonadota bacterium]